MPLPVDKDKRAEFWAFVTCGDSAATEYLEMVANLVYLADDSADEDLDFATRQRYLMEILHIAMCRMPMNAFFARYSHTLAPLLMDVIVHWQKSDEWKQTGDLKRKIFGFVRRENIDSLVVAVSAIVGGIDHAGRVTERIMDTAHTSGETLEEWMDEGKP